MARGLHVQSCLASNTPTVRKPEVRDNSMNLHGRGGSLGCRKAKKSMGPEIGAGCFYAEVNERKSQHLSHGGDRFVPGPVVLPVVSQSGYRKGLSPLFNSVKVTIRKQICS